MVAMLAEAGAKAGNGGTTDVAVPPTIQALLAARLDQLETSERAVLERGSVEGQIFHRGAVQALAPEEPQVDGRLMKLVRKDLVRPEAATLAGDEAYRFRHLLVRDAAYEALPKATRADLHKRFAAWLEERGTDLVELNEILGYHLEQAFRYRAELGTPGGDELAAAARRHLTVAGRRAILREDYIAARKLIDRALALVPPDEIDAALEYDRLVALFISGETHEAYLDAVAAAERAADANDRRAELTARITAAIFRMYVEPEGATELLAALVEEAIPVLEADEDDLALYIAYHGRSQVAHMRARMDDELEALELSLVRARKLGLSHEGWIVPSIATARFHGTTSASEVLAWLDTQETRGKRDSGARAQRASLLAMLDRPEEARTAFAELRAELEDRGATIPLALALALTGPLIELLIGDAAAAVELGEAGCQLLEEMGERSWLSTAAGVLAEAYYELGRLDKADAWAARAAELGASDDAVTQMLWRQVKAKVLARQGVHGEAERLAREAIAIADQIDLANLRGDAYLDLAEVLALAPKNDEAVPALEHALEIFDRKGNLVSAQRVRERLTELQG